MTEKARISPVSEAERNAIREKSAHALPDSPRDHGMKAGQVKPAFWKPLVQGEASVVGVINRVINEINAALCNGVFSVSYDPETEEMTVTFGNGRELKLEGPKQGPQGEPGKDGLTPVVEAVREDGGTRVTVTVGSEITEFVIPDGQQGAKGDGLAFARSFTSVAEMEASFTPDAADGVKLGQHVIITADSVEDEDNSKFYLKTADGYRFVNDLSGAIGIQGPRGFVGPVGPRGATGARGSKWFWGSEDPVGYISGAQYGDLYLNLISGDVFSYDTSVWHREGCIKGASSMGGTGGTIVLVSGVPVAQFDADTKLDRADALTRLSDMTGDTEHRTVTDAEKEDWNAKANAEAVAQQISAAKQEVMNETKAYTDQEIAEFDFIKVVDALPTTGLPNKIYLVPKSDAQTQDLFDEYVWVNGGWEWIATKQIEVDLTPYAKTSGSYPNIAAGGLCATLGVTRGGTGKTSHTSNAVLTGNGTSAIKNVGTKPGAFYATATNGSPQFGTLPIAQGGTGAKNAEGIISNINNTVNQFDFQNWVPPTLTGYNGTANSAFTTETITMKTASGLSDNWAKLTGKIQLKKNANYTLSCKTTYGAQLFVFFSDGSFMQSVSGAVNPTVTFTTPDDGIVDYFRIDNDNTNSAQTNVFSQFVLNEGDTAAPYQAFNGGGIVRTGDASNHTHTTDDFTGVLPISKGGTGATTVLGALQALGFYDGSRNMDLNASTFDAWLDLALSNIASFVPLDGANKPYFFNLGWQNKAFGSGIAFSSHGETRTALIFQSHETIGVRAYYWTATWAAQKTGINGSGWKQIAFQ